MLGTEGICEFGDWSGGAVHCVLHQRSRALEALALGQDRKSIARSAADLGPGGFQQCVVHLQQSRPATLRDVRDGLLHLDPGGELLVIGYNELGIRSLVKQLERLLGTVGTVRSNRRRGRVVGFARDLCQVPPASDGAGGEGGGPVPQRVHSEPGVFSADRLDPGSALLLSHLRAQGDTAAPSRVLDLGCGAGPLGLQAAALWPHAHVVMLDGDLRAVRSARHNAAQLGLSDRVTIHWWDAAEPVPAPPAVNGNASGYDLVLVNPPFHIGKGVDMGPAIKVRAEISAAIAGALAEWSITGMLLGAGLTMLGITAIGMGSRTIRRMGYP